MAITLKSQKNTTTINEHYPPEGLPGNSWNNFERLGGLLDRLGGRLGTVLEAVLGHLSRPGGNLESSWALLGALL